MNTMKNNIATRTTTTWFHITLIITSIVLTMQQLNYQWIYLPIIIIISYMLFQKRDFTFNQTRVVVLVLGDYGRSPRMQYHTLSLANMNKDMYVDVVSMKGTDPLESISCHPRIHLHLVSPWSYHIPRSLFVILGPIKVIYQTIQFILILLFSLPYFHFLLVQNPPAIPSLIISQFVCWIRWCKFIIDWHNYGYTILGLKLGSNHVLTKMSYYYERIFGRYAYAHFCVTKAMQKDLKDRWMIHAKVLYDKPPSHFHKCSIEEIHHLWTEIRNSNINIKRELDEWLYNSSSSLENKNNDSTWFTCMDRKGNYVLNKNRPAVVVSSTSWTPDEDFSILLDAVIKLEKNLENQTNKCKVLFIITGKGPEKEMYLAKIKQLKLINTKIITVWLTARQYPLLLGCCDLGVCLHTSSSGLDLPMKVVDMFGAALPVCAIQFNCLHELVVDQKNGLIFNNSNMLAQQISQLFQGFPKNTTRLNELSNETKLFRSVRWEDSWTQIASTVFK